MANKQKNNKADTTLVISGGIEAVPAMLEKIKTEKSKLRDLDKTNWKTNKNFSGVNISPESGVKIEILVEALGRLDSQEQNYDNACANAQYKSHLPAKLPVFKVGGFTAEDWRHDLLFAIDIITQDEQRKRLQKYEEKLSKFVTEEQQLAMILKEMAEEIGAE